MIGLTHKQRDTLAEIKGVLDANPFADPVIIGSKQVPRSEARKMERELQCSLILQALAA